jgi:hypothetical protein
MFLDKVNLMKCFSGKINQFELRSPKINVGAIATLVYHDRHLHNLYNYGDQVKSFIRLKSTLN